MKKIVSLTLALMMVFTLAVSALATELTANGTITINGLALDAEGKPVATYQAYRMLVLETYDVKSGAYSYKVDDNWTNFFVESTGALNYFSVGDTGYVSLVENLSEDDIIEFSQIALAWAKANNIAADCSTKTSTYSSGTQDDGTTYLKFSNLPMGYYLVDSTVGALCGLTTTNPNASIQAKNHIPTMDKQVQEDSTGEWGSHNTADIGQTIYFRITIDVSAGAENYVFHDTMSEGLTFDKVTKVEHLVPGSTGAHQVAETDYTVVTDSTLLKDGCTFEVHFSKGFHDKLSANDKIIIYYQAMLNRHAVIKDANSNSAYLSFGEGNKTTTDSTNTNTYQIQIVKTDGQNLLIDGAQFRIYDAETGGNEVGVVPLLGADDKTPVLDANDNPVYRRARADEVKDGKTVPIVVHDGVATVVGLDNGTYYLEEVVAPAGYNKLATRTRFIVNNDNMNATFNDNVYSVGSGIHVVNKTGTMLPETGAMGTTMFVFFGALVVLTTGVLLVTKKRMSMIED